MANTLTFQNSGLRAFNQTQQNFSQLVNHDFNNDYRYPDQISSPDVEKNSITIGGDMIQGHHIQNNSSNPGQGYDMFDPKQISLQNKHRAVSVTEAPKPLIEAVNKLDTYQLESNYASKLAQKPAQQTIPAQVNN